MGCFGDKEKGPPEQKQRWEFIELSDFKNNSVWTCLGYGWLWFMAVVGVAVYGVDTFTAVNLLVFDKWSSQIQPWLPFEYSKWIFAACILFSWALCIYEWMRAIRVIRRGGVAASYMDPLGASLQSMRPKGWRRFLVFTELTKSKKGTDYIAFFVYFAFQGAIRVVLAEGPRQVVNALTLGSIMELKLINHGKATDGHSGIVQFFLNIQALADQNYQQAIILSSMLFTLVIWVFSALCLIAAAVLYLVFLWHYIPQRDGRLRIYCRRKIDRRLEKIVEHKVKAGIEEENRRREKAEEKAELKRQKTGGLPPLAPPKIARQPTLPQLGESPDLKHDEKSPDMTLNRQDTSTTVSTLPLYSSRPPTRQSIQRQPTLPDIALGGERPVMPSRMGTDGSQWSKASYDSDAPLLSNAGYAGGDPRLGTPAPVYSRQNSSASTYQPMPGRTMTQSTQSSQPSFTPMLRMDTHGSQTSYPSRPPPGQRFPVRSNTGFSFDSEPQSAISPTSPLDQYGRPVGLPQRQNTSDSFSPVSAMPLSAIERRPTYGSLHSQQSSFSRPIPRKASQASSFQHSLSPTAAVEGQPTPPLNSYEMSSRPSYGSLNPGAQRTESYVAFNPSVHRASEAAVPHQGPRRNVTIGGQPGTGDSYFGQVQQVSQRSATAPPVDHRAISHHGSVLDEHGANTSANTSMGGSNGQQNVSSFSGPPRAYTAQPQGGMWYDRI